MEVVLELDPRGQRHSLPANGDVKVILVHAPSVLGRVDGADRARDADALQVLDVGNRDPLEALAHQQELELQHLAVFFAHAVLDGPSSIIEELRGRAQRPAVAARSISLRRRISLIVQDPGRQLVGKRFEQHQFVRSRLAFGLHRPAFEKTVGAVVKSEEQGLVRPFEIERHRNRLAHVWVLELLAPQIEPVALSTARIVVGDDLLDHVSALDRWEVIAGGPKLGPEFLVEGVGAGLEGFEGRRTIAEIFEPQALEIPAIAVYRKVPGPIIVTAPVDDGAPGFQAFRLDGIGPR